MKKLKLSDLRVSSFITTLNQKDSSRIVGASGNTCGEPTNHCTPPQYASINWDCAITRINDQCIIQK